MKNKLFLNSLVVVLGLFLGLSIARAETVKITFPIDDLGGCKDTKDCKAYCDQLEHASVCANFGQSRGLISKDQAEQNRKFVQIPKGPGGCSGKDACEQYCQDAAHLDECIQFAKQHKLVPDEQLKKMQNFRQALTQSDTPGSCHDQRTCQTFCEERSHNEECLKWAKKHELVAGEEADKLQKFQEFVAKNETPGRCDDKNSCYQFCSDKTHFDECQKFGEKMGFVKPKQADSQKKMDMKGPGGCDSKEACEKFCNDPQSTPICIDFAKNRGLLKPEQARDIEDSQKHGTGIENMPPALRTCLKQFVTDSDLEQMKTGKFAPEAETAKQMKECYAQYGQEQGMKKPPMEQKQPEQSGEQGQKRPLPQTNLPNQTKPPVEQNEETVGGMPPKQLPPRQLPPGMDQCVTQIAGADALAQIKLGQFHPTDEVKQKIMACMGQTEPARPPQLQQPNQ